MSDAHELNALVTRQLLTDGSFGEESLTAHGAHGWQREFFRHLQHMHGVVAAPVRPCQLLQILLQKSVDDFREQQPSTTLSVR